MFVYITTSSDIDEDHESIADIVSRLREERQALVNVVCTCDRTAAISHRRKLKHQHKSVESDSSTEDEEGD